MSTENDDRGTAAVLADEIKQLHGAELFDLAQPDADSASLAILPEGKTIEDVTAILDKYRPAPRRRVGTAKLTDAESFIKHVNRFKGADSAVFANPARSAPSFTAVFDYHPTGGDATKADFMKHRAVYAPDLSDPWKVWTASDGKMMTQELFAEFIEKNITDIVVPNLDDPDIKTFAELVEGRFATPSDLLALSRGLQVNVAAVVKSGVTLSSGEIAIRYEETHQDGKGAPIQVANLFQICIPVFYAGALYRIAARLRYRLSGGTISWCYVLVRTDLVFDDAFRGIADRVEDETVGVPVFLGSPEA